MARSKYFYQGWRRKVAITFYLVSLLALVASIERLVFDVLGQMWGTMLVNGMNLICTMTGILGTCIKEKIAMAVYTVWSVISIGLNIIIILIYQDIGLLSQKEHVLGLALGNDNWWRALGVICSDEMITNSTLNTSVMMSGDETIVTCVVSYVTVETVHAAVYMALTLISVSLIIPLLCLREKKPHQQQQFPLNSEEDEDFSFVNIAQWYDYPNSNCHGNRWQHSLRTPKTRAVT